MSRFVRVKDYEQFAEDTLSKMVRENFNSGAFYEHTYADNVAAFMRRYLLAYTKKEEHGSKGKDVDDNIARRRYKFRPRYMRDVSVRRMATSLLGQKVSSPIGVSPMAMCRLAHPDGEVALAKACEAEGLCFTLSMAATASVEEVGQTAPNCTRWFQVQMLNDRDMMQRVIARAERAGFSALVLTVDCPEHAKRYQEEKNQLWVPSHLKIASFHEELKRSRADNNAEESKDEWTRFWNQVFSSATTWQDVQWLKSVSALPVVAKGVMTGYDAVMALNHGADAIWVSNHGGRELDHLPATIDVVGEVCDAVKGRAEVYLDGGVRSGLDVLKALARGARAVFCSRPALWGMTHSGQEGAQHVLKMLQEELSIGLALTGVTDVQKVPSDIVVHQSFYSRY